MKIAMGADNGGYSHKEAIKKHLIERGFEVKDFGAFSDARTDYNDYALLVAESVRDKEYDRGILVCGTGIGMSVMANKVCGIRAALVHDLFTAEATRLHNNSNILVLSGRFISEYLAQEIIDVWFNTEFEGGRHQKRLDKISDYEKEK